MLFDLQIDSNENINWKWHKNEFLMNLVIFLRESCWCFSSDIIKAALSMPEFMLWGSKFKLFTLKIDHFHSTIMDLRNWIYLNLNCIFGFVQNVWRNESNNETQNSSISSSFKWNKKKVGRKPWNFWNCYDLHRSFVVDVHVVAFAL